MQGRSQANRLRPRLPFRAVNRRGTPQHDPALQRHHLLPRQLLSHTCFGVMFDQLGIARIGFHDSLRAGETALMRLALLRDGLRRRLLDDRTPYRLNRNDPLGAGLDFSDLDAMAEALWRAT